MEICWPIGFLALWFSDSPPLGLLRGLCGSLVLWLDGSVTLWFPGPLALWLPGSLALWPSIPLALGLRGSLAHFVFWFSSALALWLYGSLAPWLSAFRALLLFGTGSMALLLYLWLSGFLGLARGCLSTRNGS